jgi:hypothetical protein
MKTSIECPHCHSKKTNIYSKSIQIGIGLGMLVSGLGFLIPALATAVGYYLFALPLCTVGVILIYKGYTDTITQVHCKECGQEFECLLN